MNEPTALEPATMRLREAPATRFSVPQHAFDLLQLSAHLLNEAHVGTNGHRQMTIFRQDATTMVFFAFEAGGALTTEVQSEAGWQTHDLRAQGILVLSTGVIHSVAAHEARRVLLTAHLERGAGASQ